MSPPTAPTRTATGLLSSDPARSPLALANKVGGPPRERAPPPCERVAADRRVLVLAHAADGVPAPLFCERTRPACA